MATGDSTHCVAVVGGAVAGAEVAGALADRGAEVVVFEQNARPYGKIEDGLPRWHVALRQKEYASIGAHLSRANVHFVPLTRVGRDIAFSDLARDWGFTAVVLARSCGAVGSHGQVIQRGRREGSRYHRPRRCGGDGCDGPGPGYPRRQVRRAYQHG